MLGSPDSELILSNTNRRVQSAELDRRAGQAAPATDLAGLAAHLPPDQRALVIWIAHEGRTRVEVAGMLSCTPRLVAARYTRIVIRLRSPEFALCVLHSADWPRDLRGVAERCVLAGDPVRRAAAELGLTVHAVRRLREQIMSMARGARLASKSGSIHQHGGASWRGNTRSACASRWRRSA